MWLEHIAYWLIRQNDFGYSATLVQWARVLTVATSAEYAAEEATNSTARFPLSHRPVQFLRPRRKNPKLKPREPKLGDKSDGTSGPSHTSSSEKRQPSEPDDLA
ncbi:hypothetical protein MRX96_058183 [Rhipicephalus microplus]